jgi:hypothetical protein
MEFRFFLIAVIVITFTLKINLLRKLGKEPNLPFKAYAINLLMLVAMVIISVLLLRMEISE